MEKALDISQYLPETVKRGIERLDRNLRSRVCEIRLRKGYCQSLTLSSSESLFLSSDGVFEKSTYSPFYLSEKDISDCLLRLCDGSVYSFSEQIKKGFITKSGCRVGICGKGIMSEGIECGFSEYTSLNIRVPKHIPSASDKLLSHISENGREKTGGVLVISPPGAGKTTFLRSFASALSGGFYEKGVIRRLRVAVVDEREEIYLPEAFPGTSCDFISNLPKSFCIELLTRVMSPEYIILDEIGNGGEAEEIIDSVSRGVTFAASCHGRKAEDVLEREGMRKLLCQGIFQTMCILSEKNGSHECSVVRAEDFL